MTDSQAESREIALTRLMDLQEQLLMASVDLERVSDLVRSATAELWEAFNEAMAEFQRAHLDESSRRLQGAITAMQFEDMTNQILSHNVVRLHRLADALGAAVDDASAPDVSVNISPSAVAQRAMDAGSTELF